MTIKIEKSDHLGFTWYRAWMETDKAIIRIASEVTFRKAYGRIQEWMVGNHPEEPRYEIRIIDLTD